VNKPAADGRTPLVDAALNGNTVMCRLLLTEGKADVNAYGIGSAPPLFAAAQKGNAAICRLLLIEGGADVNRAASDGATAIFTAASCNHLEVSGCC